MRSLSGPSGRGAWRQRTECCQWRAGDGRLHLDHCLEERTCSHTFAGSVECLENVGKINFSSSIREESINFATQGPTKAPLKAQADFNPPHSLGPEPFQDEGFGY